MSFDLEIINAEIRDIVDRGMAEEERISYLSDGYHTFNELYRHRIALFKALCFVWHMSINKSQRTKYSHENEVWHSRYHSDGTAIEGWFIAGIGVEEGRQITYHIPMSEYDNWPGIEYPTAPQWDGHTSADVIERLNIF